MPRPGAHGPGLPDDGQVESSHALRLRELAEAGVVEWGEHSYGAPVVHAYPGDRGRLVVGRYCSFALEVEVFLGGEHRTDWVSTFPLREVNRLPGAHASGHPATRGDVVIGSDVWLGRGCLLRSGVHVGDGAVIGARAVVTRDVRPYAVVAGNPARELRRRFSDQQIDGLLRIAWWDWPDSKVLGAVDLLNGAGVDEFLEHARGQPGHA